MMLFWRVRNPLAHKLLPALLFCALVLIPVVVQKTSLEMTKQPGVQSKSLRNEVGVVHLPLLPAGGVARVMTSLAEMEPVEGVGVEAGPAEAAVSPVVVAADEEDEGVPDAVEDVGEGLGDEEAEGLTDGVMELQKNRRVQVCSR